MLQRIWHRIYSVLVKYEIIEHLHTLALSPSLQIASRSARDCLDAAGDVTSIWSSILVSRPHKLRGLSHIFHSKGVQGLGNFELLLKGEMSLVELLALSEGSINDAKVGEITNRLVQVHGGLKRPITTVSSIAAAGPVGHGMARMVLDKGSAIPSNAAAAAARTILHGVAGVVGDWVVGCLHGASRRIGCW